MKKTLRLLASAIIILSFASCEKEKENGEKQPEQEVPVLENIEIVTTQVTDITAESAVSGGNITKDGGNEITKRGVCWAETADPEFKHSHTEDGAGAGSFTSTLSGLAPGKTYHVRAYASCAAGIAYGNDVSFQVPVFEPVVKTGQVTDINISGAVVAGEVTSVMGGTISEVGVCIGTSAEPTEKVAAASVADKFTVQLTNLEANTTYFVRAYAVNEAGTGYGADVEFTTSDDPVITVADENLQAILEYEFGDDNGDLRKSVADTITTINIANQGITTLDGIKQFPSLKVLIANNNSIADVDVAGMTSLELFDVAFNKVHIDRVDLTGCTSLKIFWANDPFEGIGAESFAFELPALEELYLSVWHNLKTLDVTASTNLRVLSACQLYEVQKIDLTHSNVLNYVWIPDIFACTDLRIKSDALDYLGMWNAQKLTSLDLSECPNLRELVANDSYEISEFKLNCAKTMKILNVNCFRKLTSLDLTEYTNLESLNAIQLFQCSDLKLPEDLGNLRFAWLADLYAQGDLAAPHTETLTFNNVRSDARILMWGCKGIVTFNYETEQEVVGWNYGDDPNVVTDQWATPCNDQIVNFNITAPNAKRLYCSNLHALKNLDLKGCPNLEYLCMPDAWVMENIDLSACTKLNEILIWNCNALRVLDLSACAETINELNVGIGDGKCDILEKIILRTGQTITTLFKEESVAIEYK